MPYAIQWGMPLYEFWHGEEALIYAYKKAYDRDVYQKSHIQGHYVYLALETSLANMFMKKGQKPLQYPNEIFDPYDKIKNKKLSKEDIEIKHRENNSFWSNIGNN